MIKGEFWYAFYMEFLQDKDTYLSNRSEYKDKGLVYYSRSEERINCISHLLAGVLGLSIMIYTILLLDKPFLIFTAALSGLFCAFPYTVSFYYHFTSNVKRKATARKIDHAGVGFIVLSCGIPLCLGMKIHVYDIVAISVCTAIAFGNIIMSIINLQKFSRLMMILDVVIALLLTAAYFVNRQTISEGAKWFFISGAVFCLLAFSFFGRKTQYMHSVFHILSLLGTTAFMHAGMFILL